MMQAQASSAHAAGLMSRAASRVDMFSKGQPPASMAPQTPPERGAGEEVEEVAPVGVAANMAQAAKESAKELASGYVIPHMELTKAIIAQAQAKANKLQDAKAVATGVSGPRKARLMALLHMGEHANANEISATGGEGQQAAEVEEYDADEDEERAQGRQGDLLEFLDGVSGGAPKAVMPVWKMELAKGTERAQGMVALPREVPSSEHALSSGLVHPAIAAASRSHTGASATGITGGPVTASASNWPELGLKASEQMMLLSGGGIQGGHPSSSSSNIQASGGHAVHAASGAHASGAHAAASSAGGKHVTPSRNASSGQLEGLWETSLLSRLSKPTGQQAGHVEQSGGSGTGSGSKLHVGLEDAHAANAHGGHGSQGSGRISRAHSGLDVRSSLQGPVGHGGAGPGPGPGVGSSGGAQGVGSGGQVPSPAHTSYTREALRGHPSPAAYTAFAARMAAAASSVSGIASKALMQNPLMSTTAATPPQVHLFSHGSGSHPGRPASQQGLSAAQQLQLQSSPSALSTYTPLTTSAPVTDAAVASVLKSRSMKTEEGRKRLGQLAADGFLLPTQLGGIKSSGSDSPTLNSSDGQITDSSPVHMHNAGAGSSNHLGLHGGSGFSSPPPPAHLNPPPGARYGRRSSQQVSIGFSGLGSTLSASGQGSASATGSTAHGHASGTAATAAGAAGQGGRLSGGQVPGHMLRRGSDNLPAAVAAAATGSTSTSQLALQQGPRAHGMVAAQRSMDGSTLSRFMVGPGATPAAAALAAVTGSPGNSGPAATLSQPGSASSASGHSSSTSATIQQHQSSAAGAGAGAFDGRRAQRRMLVVPGHM